MNNKMLAGLLLTTMVAISGCASNDTKTTNISSSATEKQWCAKYPNSAICPEAIAAAKREQEWCRKYPASAICPDN